MLYLDKSKTKQYSIYIYLHTKIVCLVESREYNVDRVIILCLLEIQDTWTVIIYNSIWDVVEIHTTKYKHIYIYIYY